MRLGALARTRSRVYDSLNRLAQEVGAVAQTTTHGYDGNGNRLTTTDPLDRGTANTYDALNRLLTVTDPVAGVRETAIEEPDASAAREAVGMSQREFANVVGVPVKTLQNWEQKRTRPTGPARALLRAIAKDPKHVLRALAA